MTSWLSFHVYYHGDRSLLLRQVVRPRVTEWLSGEGLADRFFFIRYSLGGPHVRLRVRLLSPEAGDFVRDQLCESAEAFFADHPSPSTVPDEEIREQTRRLVAGDPLEHDETVYPDLHVREAPFLPETERYGGASHFQASVDFFMASSIVALDFLERYGDKTWPQQLPQVLRLLIAQGKGLAADPSRARELFRYGVDSFGVEMPTILESGDAAYEKQSAVFQRLVRATPSVAANSALELLHDNARALRRRLDSMDPAARWRILWSQMHMTANRMGLNNPEEVYLSKILQRAGDDVEDVGWSRDKEIPSSADRLAYCLEHLLVR